MCWLDSEKKTKQEGAVFLLQSVSFKFENTPRWQAPQQEKRKILMNFDLGFFPFFLLVFLLSV